MSCFIRPLHPKVIVPPYPSCNTKKVSFLGGIYETAEFKQKRSAYLAEKNEAEKQEKQTVNGNDVLAYSPLAVQ